MDLLENWVHSLGDSCWAFSGCQEVGEAGDDADVGVWTNLLEGSREDAEMTAWQNLGPFKTRMSSATCLVDVRVNVRVSE